MSDDRSNENDTVNAGDDAAQTPDQPVVPAASDDSPENAVGAYLLDALPEPEREAFESFLAVSPDTQAEVRQLAPVVALLPKLLDVDDTIGATAPAPSAELRERIMSEARGDLDPEQSPLSAPATDFAASARARTIRTAPEGTGPFGPKRAQGRIRSGVATGAPTARRPSPLLAIVSLPGPWLLAAGLTIVAVGAIIWALALQGRIDSKDREIVAQSAEIAQLRENANATAYTLSADGDGGEAGGTLLFSLRDQIGVLYVHSLPKLASDRVYQLWYLDDQTEAPVPGGTFTVDRNGNGVVAVSSDTPTYDGIALTEEPEGGSKAPTSAIILHGRLGGAAG